MGSHRVAGAPLDFAGLRSELEVPGDFAIEIEAEAAEAAKAVQLPPVDATDIPFVTLDPAGSRDLDQAVHIARSGKGYLVHYAIADVAAFVHSGSALEVAALARRETFYFPDTRIPLHPTSLSEGAASLLPGQVRPAVLWRIDLDSIGAVEAVQVRRARVRSRQQYDYASVQRSVELGTPPEALALLQEVGERRGALARARHAIDINLPAEEVVRDAQGAWTLTMRKQLPVEQYNSEISLLTGMCAAQLMIDGGIGILRTVPHPNAGTVHALRHVAHALQVDWPAHAEPGDVLATLDRSKPTHVAFIEHAAALLRGASYTVFDGHPPAETSHAGIGAPYAHVTAPLRRLVDRYATEICLSLQSRAPIPDWVRVQFDALPNAMHAADQLSHLIDRAVVDMTEAWLLRDRIGEVFSATVIDADPHAATIVLDEPPVRARCSGEQLAPGMTISARLTIADVLSRAVRFERA